VNGRLEKVNSIIEDESNWRHCPGRELVGGVMVSVYKALGEKILWRGFITDIKQNNHTFVRVHDPMMSMDSDYKIDDYFFEILAPADPVDFQFVSDHYLDVAEFRRVSLGHKTS
jgi:hypothetical protein